MNQANAFLPSTEVTHVSIYHALKFKLCSESLLAAPRSAVVDGIISYGGSTGIGFNLPRKVYGEFFERNHFFTGVPITAQKKMTEILNPAWQTKLKSLCRHVDKKAFKEHLFSFTQVHHLFSEAVTDYFYNAISLNGVKADIPYLYFNDSCACASHPIKEEALYYSLMEFLERQSLLGSWLTRQYQYTINPALLKEISPYTSLIERLLENGDLYVFENSMNLPGYTVILFYFAHSSEDVVQYAVGSKSALSLQKALSGAFEELYQSYTFLYNLESTSTQLANKAGSGYHLNFQKHNTQNTRQLIPFMDDCRPFKINTLADLKALKTFTWQEVLEHLAELSTDIFYYHHYDQALKLHVTKILSPDFFAHMSLDNLLHFDHHYAKTLAIDAKTAYRETIPFP